MKYSKWQRADRKSPTQNGGYEWRCEEAGQGTWKAIWLNGAWCRVSGPGLFKPSQRCRFCQWRGRID